MMIQANQMISADEILAWDDVLASEGMADSFDMLNDSENLISLEDAGLEEIGCQPKWGDESGVCENVAWWSDGEDSRWETN